jgi:hypothetical protein
MRVEFGVCPNCSEAVLRLGIGDRDVVLAVLAAVGVHEVRRDRFYSGRGTAYLLTDGSLSPPRRWKFGRQVFLTPSPGKWQEAAPGETIACEVMTSADPDPVLFPFMKRLQDALGLAGDCHDSCYNEWLRRQGAEPPRRHPLFPALPESGWGLALLVPWRRREAAEAAWRSFLDLYGGDVARHLPWAVVDGGGRGCAVLVRGLDAVPLELYRSLDRLVGAAVPGRAGPGGRGIRVLAPGVQGAGRRGVVRRRATPSGDPLSGFSACPGPPGQAWGSLPVRDRRAGEERG